jgi:hypothetical protein
MKNFLQIGELVCFLTILFELLEVSFLFLRITKYEPDVIKKYIRYLEWGLLVLKILKGVLELRHLFGSS